MCKDKVLYSFLAYLCLSTWVSAKNNELEERIKKLSFEIKKNSKQIKSLKSKEKRQQKKLLDANQRLEKTYPSLLPEVKSNNESLWALTTYPKSSEEKHYFPFVQFETADRKNSFSIRPYVEMNSDIFSNFNGMRINTGVSAPPVINQNTLIRTWLNNTGFLIESKLNNEVFVVAIPSFSRNQAYLADGHISLEKYKLFNMRAGYQTSLMAGLGLLVFPYVNYTGFSTNMAPTKENGVVWYGTLGESRNDDQSRYIYFGLKSHFSYQFGIFNGTSDGTFPGLNPLGTPTSVVYVSYSNFASNKSFEGRVFYHPFFNQKDTFLEYLGVGVAASTEKPNAQTLLPYILSVGQNPVFGYAGATTYVVSSRTRYHPQLFWHRKQMGIYADWAQTLQNLTNTYPSPVLKPEWVVIQKNKASEVQVFYNLTGEEFTVNGFIKPNDNFNMLDGSGWGALQVYARFTSFVADPSTYSKSYSVGDSTFYYISDPRISIAKATGWSVGLNWFWNSFFKMRTEFAQTKFVGGCSTGAFNDPNSPGCLSSSPEYYALNSSKIINRPDELVAMQSISLYF